jgi:hypothetical protein
MITKANVLGFLLPKETKVWELSTGDLIDVTETLEVVVRLWRSRQQGLYDLHTSTYFSNDDVHV